MANPEKKIIKSVLPRTHSRAGEEVVTGYVDSEHILDPADPRAVQVPTSGPAAGGGNPLDVQTQPSPAQVAGDEPQEFINPHTGEVVTGSEAAPEILSPTPDNVPELESVDEVQTASDFAPVESSPADAQVEADPEPVVPEPAEVPPQPEPEAPNESVPSEEPAPASDESPSPV